MNSELIALQDTVQRLLADHCTEAQVRRVMASDSGLDAQLWQQLAHMGVAGLLLPEAVGGAGLDAVALECVMEAAGAALAPVPLIGTAMASSLLVACRSPEAMQLAADIASGQRVAAVILCDAHDWAGQTRLQWGRATGRTVQISGLARFVPDGAQADVFLIAHHSGVYAVAREQAQASDLPTFDRTRRLADVRFNAATAQRLSDEQPAQALVQLAELALHTGVVALAGEQAGGARRVLNITTDYATLRHQFGRAIGSYQAIKHMAADLLIEVENATSAARHAAQQLAHATPEANSAVALAAFACGDAFVRCAKDGVQMHGGIAFTWEHPMHLYLRRARSAQQLLGDSRTWRERYVQALEIFA